ncbi:MAG: Dabb family protein [Phycisphaeraceae bacterium]|nr:Dabb family protein [Phycisphaeraceae bacterium]MCW5753204.1 Dabb family protein [Phycisphaeraceae bacterium]
MLRILCASTLAACAIGLAGCSTCPSSQTAPAPRPALISHIVLISLHDTGDIPSLIADSDRLLPFIPGVVAYAAGQHIDTGRPSVLTDYHVGLYIGFASVQDYAVYVDHPNHVELVETWRPRIASLRVWDVLDETP